MQGFKRHALGAIFGTTCALALTSTAVAQEYEWPRLLVIGTPGTSASAFAATNGWAAVLQEQEGLTVRVVPEANEPQRYRRLTDRRDIAVSSVAAATMRSQVQGIGGYAADKPAPMRILWHQFDAPWGFIVAGDSEIQSLADIKEGGLRLAVGAFSPTMTLTMEQGIPAFLGETPAEIAEKNTFVPFSSYAQNCRSIAEGRADIAFCNAGTAFLVELEGAPGSIRWLPLPAEDEEAWSRLLEVRPMWIPAEISFGVRTARGVEGAISNFVYAVTADADEDFAYNMARWMHESHDSYKGTHPLSTRMSLDLFRAFLDRTSMPVHPGTIRYLREIGAWTAEDDAWNQAAVERMDAWVAARQAALDEARDRGVRADMESEAYLEILRKHTEGLEGFKSRL